MGNPELPAGGQWFPGRVSTHIERRPGRSSSGGAECLASPRDSIIIRSEKGEGWLVHEKNDADQYSGGLRVSITGELLLCLCYSKI